MVQRYILAASNRGSAITRGVAVSTAKALMTSNPHLIDNVDVESLHWAQRLYPQNGFPPSPNYNIKTGNAGERIEEIKLLFHHDFASKVEKLSILHSLTIYLAQTPTK